MEQATHKPFSTSRRKIGRTILMAGLAAAAVDAAYFIAKSFYENTGPVFALQSIAGFWLGPSATRGGLASAMIGAVTHVGLATLMAGGFMLLYRGMPKLRASIVKMGVPYGVLLYVIMYGGVLPLRWPHAFPAFSGWASIFDIMIHIAVGVTIASVTLSTNDTR